MAVQKVDNSLAAPLPAKQKTMYHGTIPLPAGGNSGYRMAFRLLCI